jgi:flagellar assembly factor FliW
MRLFTNRFGELNFSEKEVITFKEGILGLENLTRYLVLKPSESHPLAWIQSLEEPEIALPVISNQFINLKYELDLDPRSEKELEFERREQLEAYFVVYAGKKLSTSQVNLVAPILINPASRLGKQVVQEKKQYSSRQNHLELVE